MVTDGRGLATIGNDDSAAPPALSIDDVTVLEGAPANTSPLDPNPAIKTATFRVRRSGSATGEVRVGYQTAAGSAQPSMSDGLIPRQGDYVSAGGELVFADGETDKAVDVKISGDYDPEPDETFFVNLTGAQGATIADGQGIGTIQNDDGPPVMITIGDVTKSEGQSGTTRFRCVVRLSRTYPFAFIAVDYATADGTARSPSDYRRTSGRLRFDGGDLQEDVTVWVNGDTGFERDERFSVRLSNASGAFIPRGRGAPWARGRSRTTTPASRSREPAKAAARRESACGSGSRLHAAECAFARSALASDRPSSRR